MSSLLVWTLLVHSHLRGFLLYSTTQRRLDSFSEREADCLYLLGQVSQWEPCLVHAAIPHGTSHLPFHRLINVVGIDFLSQYLNTGNVRFSYFSKWNYICSDLSPNGANGKFYSVLIILSHPQRNLTQSWGSPWARKLSEASALETAITPIVLFPSRCLLAPGNAEIPSVGAGPQRTSACFWGGRAHSLPFGGRPGPHRAAPTPTPAQLYPSHLKLALVCLQRLPTLQILFCNRSLTEDPSIRSMKPTLSEDKDEIGSCLVDAWQFLLLTCNPKAPELREHEYLATLWG